MSPENNFPSESDKPEDQGRQIEDRLAVYGAIGAIRTSIAESIFSSGNLSKGDVLLEQVPLPHAQAVMERTGVLIDQGDLVIPDRYVRSRARDILDLMGSVTMSLARAAPDTRESVGVLLGATVHARLSEVMRYDDLKLYETGINELRVGVSGLIEVLRFAVDFPKD